MAFIEYTGEKYGSQPPAFRVRSSGSVYFNAAYVRLNKLKKLPFVKIAFDPDKAIMRFTFTKEDVKGCVRVVHSKSTAGVHINTACAFAFFNFRPAPGEYEAEVQKDGSIYVQFQKKAVVRSYGKRIRNAPSVTGKPRRGRPPAYVNELKEDICAFLDKQDTPLPVQRILAAMNRLSKWVGKTGLEDVITDILASDDQRFEYVRGKGWLGILPAEDL